MKSKDALVHVRRLSLCLAPLALAAGAYAADGHVVGAIGDSITTGFDVSHIGDNKELSWATGDNGAVNSILLRVRSERGEAVGYNEAVAGSVAADLDGQITKLLKRNPDDIALTIGANDVCSWDANHAAALAKFETDMRSAIRRLVDARPDSRIYLMSIPDITNLRAVAVTHAGCQTRWNLTGLCKPLLASARTDAEREAFHERWRDANDVLDRVATEYASNVIHDPTAADTKFTWEHVSTIDCFHPSQAGQNLIAELMWNAGH
jgi:lysophospholipase L1-like esterase